MQTLRENVVERRRGFTIELNSSSDMEKVAVSNGSRGVLMEGTIGTLRHAGFVEDSVLELTGSRGVIRVDLSMRDLAKPGATEEKEVLA